MEVVKEIWTKRKKRKMINREQNLRDFNRKGLEKWKRRKKWLRKKRRRSVNVSEEKKNVNNK